MVKMIGIICVAVLIAAVAVWSWWWENGGTDSAVDSGETPEAEEKK